MINFRIATKTDAAIIAALHAQSWQQHYHNVLSKEYLNGPILQERLEVWTKRLNQPKDCLLYTSPSPRDATLSRMPSCA